ncbi:MAG: tRNA 2-thiocytidine biosynthesis TtcA family protein [Spirochaetia bacterium]
MTTPLERTLERPPSWFTRFVKNAGRGLNEFSMIGENDRVILGVSGGKDSLALALALSFRKRWLPIDYTLYGIMIDWIEYPMGKAARRELEDFFALIGVELTVVRAHMHVESFQGEFSCYLCSRNRKRILFERAEEMKVSKIALGHHLDDIVETTLINLCFRGQFATMMPVQEFFQGKLHIVRPLCRVRESEIDKVVGRLELPVYEVGCPYKHTNIRARMKPIVRELSRTDKQVREHIFSAHTNIIEGYSGFDSLRPKNHDEAP